MTATHWTHYPQPAGRHYLAGDCDSLDTLSLARWEILPGWWLWLTVHTITGPLGDITWLVTVTHRTHYHWPAGRYYLAGDCDSLDTLSLARWEILPGWWLRLTVHTITGPLGDMTWLVTATHRTHYHWPAGRHYLAGDCDSLDMCTIPGPLGDITWLVSVTHRTHYHCPLVDITWLVTATHWTHYHWPTGRHYLAGDCDSLDTLSLAHW